MRLSLEDLTVEYPGFRLGPLSTVFTTGLHAILGPNGAGKTTLLRAIAGLVHRRGRVRLDDTLLKGSAWRLVSSNLAEPPEGFNATITDYARLYVGRLAARWDERVSSIFARLGLDWMLDRRFEELSMGQRSLALTLVAIARPTPILLLDEPFAHLDPNWRCKLLSVLREEARSRIIVYTTHEFDTPRYADSLLLVKMGALIARGPPDRILTVDNLHRLYDARFVVEECVRIDCGADERRAIHRGM